MTLVLLATAAPAFGEEINRVLATVDGDPITAEEYREFVAGLGDPQASRATLLDTLITQRLIEKEAAAKGITARPDDVEAYIDEVKARGQLSDEKFEEVLASQGMTPASYRDRVSDEITQAQLIDQAIRSRVNVSPEEIGRYYEEHRQDYAEGGGVVVYDIFLSIPASADDAEVEEARARIEEIRAKASSRRAFIRLAKEHSEGPGAEQGGLLGTFERGDMTAELDEVVFALEPGDVSEPVRTADGFHLLRVDDVVEPSYRPIADVEDEIRETLYQKALAERYEDWLATGLRESHSVEVLN